MEIIKKFENILNKDMVLIYKMGKVGSTSIEMALKNKYFSIIHSHSFHSPLAYEQFKELKSIRYNTSISQRFKFRLKNLIKKSVIKRKKNLKVLTLVREPISRNISMFFQLIHIPIFDIAKFSDNRFYNKNVLHKLFMVNFNNTYGVNWFDKEFKRTFGIDIYDYEFDKNKGFITIRNNNIEFMIIKMEKLKQLETEIGAFLGLKTFKLFTENSSNNKWYADLYQNFTRDFSPPTEYIDELYNTRYMRHFYTDQEIKDFRRKWDKKRDI